MRSPPSTPHSARPVPTRWRGCGRRRSRLAPSTPTLASRMTRVLVVTYDQVGPQMAGPAIRAFELSRVLAAEHEVVLACRHEPDREGAGFEVKSFADDRDALLDLVDWAEVIVAFGFLLLEFPEIVQRDKVVVADIYDPFTLEVLVQRQGEPVEIQRREHWGALAALNEQLRVAD